MSTPVKRKVDRTANVSKDSILKTEWPLATPALLADCLAVHPGEHPEEVNQPFKSLMVAYANINQSRIAVSRAASLNASDERISGRLREILLLLDGCKRDFPLSFV